MNKEGKYRYQYESWEAYNKGNEKKKTPVKEPKMEKAKK